MHKVTLSLCVIVSDAHLSVLPRMLKSFLERSDGKPAVDEVVIDFNGKDVAAFGRSGIGEMLSAAGVRFVLANTTWTGDFSVARQANFERATGEFRMYADADDVLLGAADAQSNASVVASGGAAASKASSLQEFLRGLPPQVNVVQAPYHYHLAPDGKPLTVLRRPRIVRWDSGWAWVGKVHEQLRHALGREYGIWCPGVVLEHRPVIALAERHQRNQAILNSTVQQLDPAVLPHDLLYGLAVEHASGEDFQKASELFQQAAAKAPDDQFKLLYLTQGTRCSLKAGRIPDAEQLALAAVASAPERAEGYLAACEVATVAKKWAYAVKWYEAAKLQKPSPGAMLEEHQERVLVPARTAGLAYLSLSRFAEAAQVAREALATDSGDAFARRVLDLATEGLNRQQAQAQARGLVKQLLHDGFVGVAARVLAELQPVLGQERDLETQVAAAMLMPPTALPEDSRLAHWMAQADEASIRLMAPVDSFPGRLENLLAQLNTEDASGQQLLVCATDTEDLSPWARKARKDAVTAPRLLAALDRLGEVQELQLVEEADGSKFVRARVARTEHQNRRWRPDITFWCPHFAESWGPWRTRRWGTGGSEESVIYLAEELAKRGLQVQVFAPLDPGLHRGVHVENRVRWAPLDALDLTEEVPGTVIAQRAPAACRVAAFDPERLLIWHQDAAYPQGWTPAIARRVRNLWVSEWQRGALLEALDVEPAEVPGLVMGNGIPESCFDWAPGMPARDSLACVYASSPMRGLEPLLVAWPEILKAHPEATLHVYYGWETAPRMPGVAALKDRIMGLVANTPGVTWHGRMPQAQLERELAGKGVWLYPCVFPEGFCNLGVRATAAGMVPVYHRVAALPEVQMPSPFAYGPFGWSSGGREAFIDAAVRGIAASAAGTYDRAAGAAWARKWLWNNTADRLLAYLKETA